MAEEGKMPSINMTPSSITLSWFALDFTEVCRDELHCFTSFWCNALIWIIEITNQQNQMDASCFLGNMAQGIMSERYLYCCSTQNVSCQPILPSSTTSLWLRFLETVANFVTCDKAGVTGTWLASLQ